MFMRISGGFLRMKRVFMRFFGGYEFNLSFALAMNNP